MEPLFIEDLEIDPDAPDVTKPGIGRTTWPIPIAEEAPGSFWLWG